MELQILLVLCGIGVAGIAILLLMGLFTTSGTSYEEAIAQQRKVATELLALADNKNKGKKNNKKALKKLAKKEKAKDNIVTTTSSDVDSEALAESGLEEEATTVIKPHVDFCPPTVVDVPTDSLPNIKIKKRSKDSKVKPILVNKEDPSCVSEASSPPSPVGSTVSNRFEEIHPKDEFELLQSTFTSEKIIEKHEAAEEKKEAKPKQVKNSKHTSKHVGAKDVPKDEPARELLNSTDKPKEQRKKKKSVNEDTVDSPQVNEYQIMHGDMVEKSLKQAPVNAPTPSPTAGKTKKKKAESNVLSLMGGGEGGGVNVGELVRVVREAALSRNEIQVLTDALLNKQHDPLPQHSEWTEGPNDPIQKLKKQLAEKEKCLTDEIEASQALHAKLKELRTSLNAERASARAAEAACSSARAELHAAHARLQCLADDNHHHQQEKLMLQSKLSNEAELQAQRLQLEMHIQRLSESEAGLAQQVGALQAEVAAAHQHAADLAHQLQEANRACNELEQQKQYVAHELRQAHERLAAMGELQNEIQRLNVIIQSTENNAKKTKDDADKQIAKLSKEISALNEDLLARDAELAEARALRAAPAQNGLPPPDQHMKADELARVEAAVERLRDELAAAQRAARDHADTAARLRDQLAAHHAKNDELRTKNWKIMEALQSAEKALQAKARRAEPAPDAVREAVAKAQESQQNELAIILRAAFPEIAPNCKVGTEWFQAFAQSIKQEFNRISNSETATASQELIVKNKNLEALVDKYKMIIDDTEGVLSRLQQNVSSEEQRWSRQLADKQRELDELRTRLLPQMQETIDTLEMQLEQAQKTKFDHSFADAERHAEEKLLTSFTDKNIVDIHNGPLEVDLEEK